MTIVLRSVKGSDLTPPEVDGNFTDLDGRVHTIEVAASSAGIDFFQVIGTSLYVHMVGGAVFGPYTLPLLQWTFKGEWQATFAYVPNDVTSNSGTLYLVNIAHTSAGTFDSAATDGLGNPLYTLILDRLTSPVKTVSASTYTLLLDDANSYIRFTNAGGCAVTVPSGVFSVGNEVHLRQTLDSAFVSLTAAGGVTINTVANHLNETACRGATITIKCVAANTFDLMGLLAESP